MKPSKPPPPTSTSRKRAGLQSLPTLNPDAAGADIGAREIVVCVPSDRDAQPVRTFATFTQDLNALADWLQQCKITTIAMESTGVYWIPLFQILETRGLQVHLVNARHVKHVPGRKSDVSDAQWLQYLHSVGLLRGSFRPPQEICAIRSLARHRESTVAQAAEQILHMHKALDQMNLQLHHVINDLTGTTGLAIVRAILAGERDAKVLAEHRDRRIKASKQTIEKSLVGDWREEHLLVLSLALSSWEHLSSQIRQLDTAIAQRITQLETKLDESQPAEVPDNHKRKRGGSILRVGPASTEVSLRQEYYRTLGTDLTAVPALSLGTVQGFIAEVGPQLERFKNAASFASWLGLCPGTKISGGKVLDARSRKGKPRFALLLRQACQSLHANQSALGARYRRLRSRLGAPKALTAMAHTLARIIYTLVNQRRSYDDSIFAKKEAEHAQRQHQRLERQAQSLGFDLVPATT